MGDSGWAPRQFRAGGPTGSGIPRLETRTADLWFDKAAFLLPQNPDGTWRVGNAGRNILNSDGRLNWDFGLAKAFPLGERVRLHFRYEAFNFTNTPTLGTPNSNIESPTSPRHDRRSIHPGRCSSLCGWNSRAEDKGRRREPNKMILTQIAAGSAAIVLASVALSASAAEEQGLVAWWKFDEGAGKQAIDAATNQKDRIVTPRWIPGVSGRALALTVTRPTCCGSRNGPPLNLEAVYHRGLDRPEGLSVELVRYRRSGMGPGPGILLPRGFGRPSGTEAPPEWDSAAVDLQGHDTYRQVGSRGGHVRCSRLDGPVLQRRRGSEKARLWSSQGGRTTWICTSAGIPTRTRPPAASGRESPLTAGLFPGRRYRRAQDFCPCARCAAGAAARRGDQAPRRNGLPTTGASLRTAGRRRVRRLLHEIEVRRGVDALSRVGPYGDVVVRFDDSPSRFVFWRGASYVPHWVTENGLWFDHEWVETWRIGVVGCAEPISDKQNRYSHVRILESNDARAVVTWRYAVSDVKYQIAREIPLSGWGDWVDEVATPFTRTRWPCARSCCGVPSPRKPTSFTRRCSSASRGFKAGERHRGGSGDAGEHEGETYSYSRTPDAKEMDQPPGANIALYNLRSKYRPFAVIQPGTGVSMED